jgi:repressor LexA
MHRLQEKLLRIVQDKNLGQYTLRKIGELVGERSPQVVKHHLNQLEKKGLIRIDRARGLIEKGGQKMMSGLLKKARLLAIPVLGSANAGPSRLFAEQNVEGYLRVSSTLIPVPATRKLFALKVDGPSMNRALVEGKQIDDGDFVIVDTTAREPKDGDIVLSVIDGMANIKKFYRDKENEQIVLMSESTHSFPPIHIHEDDDFLLNGKVVQVVKKPKNS